MAKLFQFGEFDQTLIHLVHIQHNLYLYKVQEKPNNGIIFLELSVNISFTKYEIILHPIS